MDMGSSDVYFNPYIRIKICGLAARLALVQYEYSNSSVKSLRAKNTGNFSIDAN